MTESPRLLSESFAQFAAQLKYDALPAAVVEKARLLVLDTLGCAIAAQGNASDIAAAEALLADAGRGRATAIGHSGTVAPADAAFYNGTLAHILDYDDTHSGSVVHASSALVPAALAVAEEVGADGRLFIAALVTGLEVSIRIGLPTRHGFHLKGFHSTAVCAPFGAALAAGVLQGQDADILREGLGIAGSFGGGLMEAIPAGASAKQLHSGIAAAAGIRAANLARAGFTGPATVFEGRLGLYNAMLGAEHGLDLEAPVRALGEHWELMDLCPKLYPCCGHLLSFLDAAKQLRDDGVAAKDIAAIQVRTSRACSNVVCEPWARKQRPATGYEAKFSLPFAMALMFSRGHAGLADFTDDACADPAIQALMPLVTHEVDESFIASDGPAWVRVVLKDGAQRSCHLPIARGDSRAPRTPEEFITKFNANAAVLGRTRVDRLVSMVMALGESCSAAALAAELRSPVAP